MQARKKNKTKQNKTKRNEASSLYYLDETQIAPFAQQRRQSLLQRRQRSRGRATVCMQLLSVAH